MKNVCVSCDCSVVWLEVTDGSDSFLIQTLISNVLNNESQTFKTEWSPAGKCSLFHICILASAGTLYVAAWSSTCLDTHFVMQLRMPIFKVLYLTDPHIVMQLRVPTLKVLHLTDTCIVLQSGALTSLCYTCLRHLLYCSLERQHLKCFICPTHILIHTTRKAQMQTVKSLFAAD